MNITVIGTGYVGLVAGACFAELGQRVTCVDSDKAKVAALRAGQMPIHEPGLEELVLKHAGGNLCFAHRLNNEVAAPDVVILAVGTPPLPDGRANLSFLFQAAADVAPSLRAGANLVIKSTVPVGTAKALRQRIEALRPGLKVAIVSNPEFLREGCALADFMKPDRIVIGSGPRDDTAPIQAAYAPLTQAGAPLLTMSNEAAELCKYAANTYLAMRVAFVNELANLCEAVGANIESVTQGMGLDRRIGRHYLQPGPGFGGSCFPKDTSALLSSAEAANVDFLLGHAIVEANERRKRALVVKVAKAVGGVLTGKTIAVLGLAFKAHTDDTRDSPALQLVHDLHARGAIVRAYDPEAQPREIDAACLCTSMAEAVSGADAAVIMTEWDEFRRLDLKALAQRLRHPVLVDFRNLYSLAEAEAAGLKYSSVGRPTTRHVTRSARKTKAAKSHPRLRQMA